MASFGYDDLFNNAALKESFNHSRVGYKNKFLPKKGFIPAKSRFLENFDANSVTTVNRYIPGPKTNFRSANERYMTHFDQFHTMEDNDTEISSFLQRRSGSSFVPGPAPSTPLNSGPASKPAVQTLASGTTLSGQVNKAPSASGPLAPAKPASVQVNAATRPVAASGQQLPSLPVKTAGAAVPPAPSATQLALISAISNGKSAIMAISNSINVLSQQAQEAERQAQAAAIKNPAAKSAYVNIHAAGLAIITKVNNVNAFMNQVVAAKTPQQVATIVNSAQKALQDANVYTSQVKSELQRAIMIANTPIPTKPAPAKSAPAKPAPAKPAPAKPATSSGLVLKPAVAPITASGPAKKTFRSRFVSWDDMTA